MKLSDSLLPQLQTEIERHALPAEFLDTVQRWYLPVADSIADARERNGKTLLVSFNGAQGTGKSTLTAFLKLLLREQFGWYTVELSLDDFYLTHEQRRQLAAEVHPLFATRGVPGTHDTTLAADTFTCLMHCNADHPCALPSFDKASDDRRPHDQWIKVDRPVDIILFEGWCNHAPVQSDAELQQPVNELEREEDSAGVWRRYANDQLRKYHHDVFARAGLLVHLQAPSFEMVYEWRGLQERKLARSAGADRRGVMNEHQLMRFIQHYERITRACLQTLPQQADVLLQLDAGHTIHSLSFRHQRNDHA